jgi:hypothetical protein
MKSFRPKLVLVALAIILFVSSTVSAGGYYRGGGHYRGHHRGGVDVVIGGAFWGPSWYYPMPYYYPYYYPEYYSPVITVPSSPPVYIERDPVEESAPSGIWYYCPESKTYYPYVKECPGGWQTVPAQPITGPRR